MRVVLSDNHQKPWGELEIAFAPIPQRASWLTWWSPSTIRLITFILAASFLLFWLFLSRMLTVLDPAAVIPDRMQLLMDTLVEGMVILDEQGRIVMANQSFAKTAFSSVERLMGQRPSSLPWVPSDGDGGGGGATHSHPWDLDASSDLQQRGVPMELLIGARHSRRLIVNASPIPGPDGAQLGVVVTFADQTVVEADNLHMSQFVARVGDASEHICQLHEQIRSHADDAELKHLGPLAAAVRELTELCHTATRDADIPSAAIERDVPDTRNVPASNPSDNERSGQVTTPLPNAVQS
jgi:PAS domain-containing protein